MKLFSLSLSYSSCSPLHDVPDGIRERKVDSVTNNNYLDLMSGDHGDWNLSDLAPVS